MTTRIIIEMLPDATNDVLLTRVGIADPTDTSTMRFSAGQRYDFYIDGNVAVTIKETLPEQTGV